MYNLLIVDDELEILEWLKELFEYDCPLELEVHTAGSGRKAIELLNRVKCDVVLTDIKMPGMDGMELYRHIKENWPRARVVFLTGYRDHETLYEAAQNKEVRYLLKTEGDRKILDTVEDAFREIQREKEEFALKEQRGALFKKARYWLQKEFLERLVSGTEMAEPTQQQLDELEIPIRREFPLLLFLGRMDSVQGAVPYDRQEAVIEMLKEAMPGILKLTVCVLEYNYLLVLIQPKMLDQYVDWKRIFRISLGALEDIQEICFRSLEIKLTFTIYRDAVSLEGLTEKYHLLKNGMITILQEEQPGILTMGEDNLPDRKISCKGGLMKLPQLENCLEQGNREGCIRLLHEITLPLLADISRHDIGALELYYNISMVYLKIISINGLGDKIPFRMGLYKLTSADSFTSWQEAVNYLKELTEVMFEMMGEDNSYHKDQAILKVEEYIRNNLGGDLTLTVLADVGGFNAAYLSRIFKQKYHCNLSDFIVRERMNLARKLLAQTNEKVNRIGEEVGYPTPHSFTRVFKNSEGMSPVEYRARFRGE